MAPWARLFVQQGLTYHLAPYASVLSVHQNKERIVECGREGGPLPRAQPLLQVLKGPHVLDSRCAEHWENLHGWPYPTRKEVPLQIAFNTTRLNLESKPSSMFFHCRIPRFGTGVDEYLCVYSLPGNAVRAPLRNALIAKICGRHSAPPRKPLRLPLAQPHFWVSDFPTGELITHKSYLVEKC